MPVPFHPATPPLGLYPTDTIPQTGKYIHTRLFITVSYAIAKY